VDILDRIGFITCAFHLILLWELRRMELEEDIRYMGQIRNMFNIFMGNI
jgi:hypothetical protein